MLYGVNDIFSGAIAADGTRSGQAITATAISTNVIDTRNSALPTLKDEGVVGQEIYLYVSVLQGFNNLTSLTITLESDSTANLATAPVVHSTMTVLLAGLTAGAVAARIALPYADYKRYMGLRYTVAGTAPTLGSVLSEIVLQPQRNISYPSGFTVL